MNGFEKTSGADWIIYKACEEVGESVEEYYQYRQTIYNSKLICSGHRKQCCDNMHCRFRNKIT